MGLLDSILGSVTGGSGGAGGSSATSPLVKALLVMLAAKAVTSGFGHASAPSSGTPSSGTSAPSGRIESGILAGLPSLDTILGHFKQGGHGEAAQSWIGSGPNASVPPEALPQALGPEAIEHLQKETGLPRDQLLQQLASVLPQVVDKLTPNGRLPTSEERASW